MGRGLSDLQKRILGALYERRKGRDLAEEKRHFEERKPRMHPDYRREWRMDCDLTHAEVMAAIYGWERRYGRRVDRGIGGQAHNFSPGLIGPERYNREAAAYYRAVRRLENRGLVDRHGIWGSQLWITDDGIRVQEGAPAPPPG